jgi:5-methylcytosine-specific restriction endonuclease McrA
MTRKYSDDELLSLRLDPNKIPAWKEAIRQIIDEFSFVSVQKYLLSLKAVLNATDSAPARLGSLLKEKLFYQRFFGDASEEEIVKLNKWANNLDSNNLMKSSSDTSAPYFAQCGIQVDLHYLLHLEVQSTYNEIDTIEKQLKSSSVLADMFATKTPTEQLLVLKSRYRALQLYRIDVDSIQAAINFINEIYVKSQNALAAISKLEEKINLAELKLGAIERFEQRHGNSLALADKARERARRRADRLRKLVKKTSHCPYCSIELDDSAQFDHIYPVSEGGLSTVKNMIWCCSACNSVKSSKGLTTFIHERGLPLSEVLARLKALGKHV